MQSKNCQLWEGTTADCSLSTLRSSQSTFCEPAGCLEPNAAWSFDSSAVAPQGKKPVSGHLASLGDNEPE